MIQILPQSKGNILIVRAEGNLTDHDYQDILIPRLEFIIKNFGKARLLLDMEENRWSPSALWDDTQFGLSHKNSFEKMGVIGGPGWVDWGMKLISLVMSGEIRSFTNEERTAAFDWIVS